MIVFDYSTICNGRRYLYGINVWFLGHLFTLRLRSYQTDKIWIRLFWEKA